MIKKKSFFRSRNHIFRYLRIQGKKKKERKDDTLTYFPRIKLFGSFHSNVTCLFFFFLVRKNYIFFSLIKTILPSKQRTCYPIRPLIPSSIHISLLLFLKSTFLSFKNSIERTSNDVGVQLLIYLWRTKVIYRNFFFFKLFYKFVTLSTTG